MIIAGLTPNEITSAKESNSFPTSDFTCSNFATIPSKKSKTEANKTITAASFKYPLNANRIAKQPEERFNKVTIFGICFFIFKYYLRFKIQNLPHRHCEEDNEERGGRRGNP